MIRKRTVLVLGAGASIPYGFPSGLQLLHQIAMPQSDYDGEVHVGIRQMLRRLGHREDDVNAFEQAVRVSGLRSIDHFLELNQQFNEMGRTAITCAIVRCENDKELEQRATGGNGRWYDLLLNRMLAPGERWSENQLSVVSLNYDRSFEQFFMRALGQNFSQPDTAHGTFAETVKVAHLHGSLGTLSVGEDDYHPYQPSIDNEALQRAAQRIRIVHDASDDNYEAARQLLQQAERVLFWGVSYDRVVLQRLDVRRLLKGKIVHGTMFGFGQLEVVHACREIGFHQANFVQSFDTRLDIAQYFAHGM